MVCALTTARVLMLNIFLTLMMPMCRIWVPSLLWISSLGLRILTSEGLSRFVVGGQIVLSISAAWRKYIAGLIRALLASSGDFACIPWSPDCEFWRGFLGGWLEDLGFGRRRG